MGQHYIADLRPEWRANPYITFWRPENQGYTYPLSWAGHYGQAQLIEASNYYWKRDGQTLIRFAVPRAEVDRLGIAPASGIIDGDAGPVVPNNAASRKRLRQKAFIPNTLLPTFAVVTSRHDDARTYRAKSPAAARWADFNAAREAGYYSEGFWSYLADAPRVTEIETGKVTR